MTTYCVELQEAHDYLGRQGAEAISDACGIRSVAEWGSAIKRVRIRLPEGGRPRLVPAAVEDHNLTEVINQCATLERLLDALRWCLTEESGLKGFQGERCHPTTSSATDATPETSDNDLVLSGPGGMVARFEVSDVASSKDGNCKEGKDLTSLGVLRQVKKGQFSSEGITWTGNQRLFLVVSEEFASRLSRPSRHWLKGNPPHCRYVPRKQEGMTRVFEVCPGQCPA